MIKLRTFEYAVVLLSAVGSARLPAQSVGSSGTLVSPARNDPTASEIDHKIPAPREPARQDVVTSAHTKSKAASTTWPMQESKVTTDNTVPAPNNPLRAEAKSLEASQDIVVKGEYLRGSAIGSPPPEKTYTALDIRAYGADDIDTLIQSIEPQATSNVRSGSSRTLVLLNGRRTAGFSEISKIPTEAIERLEILPEDVALRYGFRPNQKVINIVTFEVFSSRVVQVSEGFATDGGNNKFGAGATSFSIKKGVQLTLNAERFKSGYLLESDRGILDNTERDCSDCIRSLLPANQSTSIGGTLRGPILDHVSASISGRYETDNNRSLLGRGINGLLIRDVSTKDVHLGGTLNGFSGKWLWSMLGNLDHDNTTITAKDGVDRSQPSDGDSSNAVGAVEFLSNGPLLKLPAGSLTASLRVGFGRSSFVSKVNSDQPASPSTLSRDRSAFQLSLDAPITKTAASIGQLALNANLAAERLSSFGTLKTFGYGLFWSPVRNINLRLSSAKEELAPTIEQLGAPQVSIPNLRAVDFSQGESVNITQITGGNPALRSESRNTINIEAYSEPFDNTDLSFILDYFKIRTNDPIVAFPIATAGIEAAFPERFSRSASGQLLRIDARPLNFKRSDQSRLRSGVSFSRPLGKGPPPPPNTTYSNTRFYPNEAALRAATPPGVNIIEVPSGSDDAKRLDASASRLTLSLFYTLNFTDQLLVQTGGPVLDLLNGSATGLRGGTPRHEIEFQTGIFKSGIGVRLMTSWRSGTTIRNLSDDGNTGLGTLSFASYTTSDFSLFIIPAQRFERLAALKWMAGVRVAVDLANVFDSRPKVTSETGVTPLNYQATYLEPLGRVARVSIRKTF